ncbi:MAG: RNA recognition motif domain-containing protein [Thermodesulfobacteriota bacterium]
MEGNKLYVGNLDYTVDEQQLMDLFDEYGEVVSVKVIEGRGFGFIELNSKEQAENAMNGLNEKEFQGRTLKINEARPQENTNNAGAFNKRGKNKGSKRGGRKDNNKRGGRGY